MVKSCIYAINNMIFFKRSLFPLKPLNKPDRTESPYQSGNSGKGQITRQTHKLRGCENYSISFPSKQ